jgi:hypothetical protein
MRRCERRKSLEEMYFLQQRIVTSKYMFIPHLQTMGQNYCIRVASKVFEDVAEFRYLGMMVTNQNCIYRAIKSRPNPGNTCYHAVQNLLSSCLLSETLGIKIYRTVILPFVLYGCETWSVTLSEKHRLRVFKNRVLREYLNLREMK